MDDRVTAMITTDEAETGASSRILQGFLAMWTSIGMQLGQKEHMLAIAQSALTATASVVCILAFPIWCMRKQIL